MPTIRYEIRSEYGLADPELLRAADKDDPEAVLEGVAMSGLVGVLRQLGDLAEFATEIFHELHEEVMSTAARGHGLKLRIQQLEAEFPPVEKAFFSHPTHSSFTYNDGTYWHANIQMDQNLITQGDMPRFILDSYEECRGPPRLFMLDKFDIAGAGACLKRYSDPSFFKTELTSRGLTELATRREKRPRNVKKKTSRGKIGQTLESLLSPDAESSSALVVPSEVSGKPVKRLVRLKSRNLHRSIEIKLMDHLLGLHSDVQKVVFDSSKRHSNGMVELSNANETTSKVHNSVNEKSVSHPLLNNENISTSMGENKRLTQTYNLEHKKIEDDLLEVPHEASEVEEADNNNLLAVQNEIIVVSTNKSGENINGYALGDAFPKVKSIITSRGEAIKLTSTYEFEYQMIEDELQEIPRDSACKVKEVGNNMHSGMNKTIVYSSSKSGDSINDKKLDDAGTTSLGDENTDEVIRSTSIYELEYPEIADKSIQQQEVNQVMDDSNTMSGDSESDFKLSDAEKITLLSDGYIRTSMDESKRLMLMCKTENQKIENSLLEEPHKDETIKSVHRAEHKELSTDSETKTGDNISIYEFGDSGSLTLSEETNNALNDCELKLKSTMDDNRFEGIGSDLKISMGVVNSIESEAEVNSERNNKSFRSVDEMYFGSDEVPDAHRIQNSELFFVEKITGFHLNNILDERTSYFPTSDSSCTMCETQEIQVPITYNLDRDFEMHLGETQDNMAEELEVIEVVSSSACETCGIEICEGPDLRSDHMEASCSSSVVEPTSDSVIQCQEYHDDLQTHTATQTDISTSCDSLSEGTPVAKNFDGFPHMNRDLPGELHHVNHKDGLVSENKSGTDELFVCLSPTTNHNSVSVISRTENSLVPASGIKEILELNDTHEEACSGSSLGKEVHNDCENSYSSDHSVEITTHEMAFASDWNGHLPDMTDQHNDIHVGCIPDSLCPLTLRPEELEEQVEDKKGCLSELNFSVTTTINDDLANTSANAMSSAGIEDIDKILNSQMEFSDAQPAEMDHFSDPVEHRTISSQDEKGAFVDHVQPYLHPHGHEVIESFVVNLNSADECIRYSSEERKQIKENAHSDENSNENVAAKDEVANFDLSSLSSTEVICSQGLLKDNSTLHTAISDQYDEMQVHGTCSSLVSKSILDKTFPSFEQPALDHGAPDPCLQLLEEQSGEKNVSFVSGISKVQPESQSSVDDSEHSFERKQDDIQRSPERSHHERANEELSVSSNFLAQSATLPEEEDTKLQASREENLASLKKLDEHFELDTLTVSSVSQPSVYDSEHSLEKIQDNNQKSPQQSHPGSASEELSVSTNFCSHSATLPEEEDTKLQALREENLTSLRKLDEHFELDTQTVPSESQSYVDNSEHSWEKKQGNIQTSPEQNHLRSANEEMSESTNFCSHSATLSEEKEDTKLQASRKENLASLRKLDEHFELDSLVMSSESQSSVDVSEHSLERKPGSIQRFPEQSHHGNANEEMSGSTSFFSATLPEEEEDTEFQVSREENLTSLRKLDEHFELDTLTVESDVITVPVEEDDKLEAIRGVIFHTTVQDNITISSQLDEYIELDIDTNPTGINDNPLVEGYKANAIAFDNNNEHNDLDVSWSNIDIQRQIESGIFTSSGIVSVHSASMMESNVKTMHPSQLPGFNMTNNKSSSQVSYADFLYQSSCSASQDIEETPPLPPLPPLQWRTVKLRDNSLSSFGNSFQNMTEKTSLFAPLPVQCNPMHASLPEDGKMVLPPHTLANISIFEAKSYQESSLESDGKWEMPQKLPQRPHIIHAERDESHQQLLEERFMDLSWTSSITSLQYENNSYGPDESKEPKLQPSFAPFLSEDKTSQHLPSVELEIFHDSNLSLDKHHNTSIGSAIDYEEFQDSNGTLCSDNDHFNSLEPSRTTALEIPHPDYAALPEENQSTYYGILWRSEDEIPNVRPCSVRNRPRDPLIEAVAAHDRSTLRKVSDLIRPSEDHKADERNLMLEQIRNRAFSLRPVVTAKQNIKGPSTNLKVAAIIEKANAIRQACAGSDEGEDEDSWSDS